MMDRGLGRRPARRARQQRRRELRRAHRAPVDRAADAVLAPTLHGALYCTLAAGRRWIDGGRPGVVLSILSTSTITGRAFTVPSSIAKSGVLAMTQEPRSRVGPEGRAAGRDRARRVPHARRHRPAAPGRRAGADPAAQVPLGRVGLPEELADLAAYLVSERAAYVNGEMVTIDGGAHLRTSGVEDLLGWTDDDWAAAGRPSNPPK